MIMLTWPSKPKHLGFDEAEGFCSAAAGAAVVSGGAAGVASFSSPCQNGSAAIQKFDEVCRHSEPLQDATLYLFSM